MREVTAEQFDIPESPFNRWMQPDGAEWALFYREPGGYRVRFPDLADFLLSGGGDILEVRRVANTSDATIEHLLLNQVQPLALSRQMKLILHASSVELPDGTAVAFAGPSGAGKSTLAAGFAVAGHRFLGDDGLLIEHRDGQCFALPSHPGIRVWQDSGEALLPGRSALPHAPQLSTKSRFLAEGEVAHCAQPRPLRCFYFLGAGSPQNVVIQRATGQSVVFLLLQNSFLLDVEEREMLAWHFSSLMRLAELDFFFVLDYPRDYALLPRVRQAVLEHAGSLAHRRDHEVDR